MAIYIFHLCFLNPDVYMLKTEWHLDLCVAYICLNTRILPPFLKMCVFSLDWNMKHWTLLDIWGQIFPPLFLDNFGVQYPNVSVTIPSWCQSPLKKQNKKMVAKTTSFLYICYTLLHDFWFLQDLELINLCLMFFNQNDLSLTFKFKFIFIILL